MKEKNTRCPLQSECERTCKHQHMENECDYYRANCRLGYEQLSDLPDILPSSASLDEVQSVQNAGHHEQQTIMYIDVDMIEPHPNNPRRDLGDLTELAASIKANGVLQNLTVVQTEAGNCRNCNLYLPGAGKCSGEHDKGTRPPCSKWECKCTYTAVIGHRRHAAAKLAGLEKVPCVISQMPIREQISTMLLENIQRNDLTVYEQAKGFQMMLNLGDSAADISTRTGFSESTVRRRLKLLELDQEEFRAASQRGASLQDYAELEKIDDIELRNKVLATVGTDNFKYSLKNAIDQELKSQQKAVFVQRLSAFATEVDTNSGYSIVKSFYNLSTPDDVQRPDDADTTQYYFFVTSYNYIYLLKDATAVQDDPKRAEKDAAEAVEKQYRTQLAELSARAYQLRLEFVTGLNPTKKLMPTLLDFATQACLCDDFCADESMAADLLDVKFDDEEEEDARPIYQIISQAAKDMGVSQERILLVAVYSGLDGAGIDYVSWQCNYSHNSALDFIYDFLQQLGYQMSDDEKALQDGSHKLFRDNWEAATPQVEKEGESE